MKFNMNLYNFAIIIVGTATNGFFSEMGDKILEEMSKAED